MSANAGDNPDKGGRVNRDEDLRHRGDGKPPGSATHPKGAGRMLKRAKTATNPATGEPNR